MITKWQVVRYTLLPGIVPRLRRIFGSGFINIASLLAFIFVSVRLLPPAHPYLDPVNFGRFGIRHVLAEASGRLVFSWKNLDQLVIYFSILAGIVALCIQVGLLIGTILSQPVLAQNTVQEMLANPSDYSEYGQHGPSQDIAFVILDKVFGVQNIFFSCVSTPGTPCLDLFGEEIPKRGNYPYPMHTALHLMLGFYAMGIGFLSMIIILYQITSVIGETAASGTPFGRRYNKAWAPVRLIIFFALLAPLNMGGPTNAYLNGAQLITLWTAKWGSNLATNGWIYYNNQLSDNYIGEAKNLIARPNTPNLGYLGRFMTLVHTCRFAYNQKTLKMTGKAHMPQAYVIPTQSLATPGPARGELMTARSIDDLLADTHNSNIVIRFGSDSIASDGKPLTDNAHKGQINPLCGELVLSVSDVKQPGARALMQAYYDLILTLYDKGPVYDTTFSDIWIGYATCYLNQSISERINGGCDMVYAPNGQIDSNWYVFMVTSMLNTGYAENDIKPAFDKQFDNPDLFKLPDRIKQKGWAGAAMWYNTIAEMNGAVTSALINTPTIIRYPELMHKVEEANRKKSKNLSAAERFDPGGEGAKAIFTSEPKDLEIARAFNNIYKIFNANNVEEGPEIKKSGNAFIDSINLLFGSTGIYDILHNRTVSPLAQLSSLGRSMIEHAIRNFGLAIGVSIGEGMISLLSDDKGLQNGMEAINNFLEVVATVGILIGFILYYLLPFLPFLYFFFGMGEWVKSIFEAMVAMPLWALAHLTIDGNGLSGPAAANGYYLLLEIFLRPILMFVGLVGSVMAFSMLVDTLNEIFAIVTTNTAGRNPAENMPSEMAYYRGPVDRFFYTMLYTILCYMIATSCFKLIDSIPLGILRWAGFGAQTYHQTSGGNMIVDRMGSNIYSSGEMTLGQVRQGLSQMKMTGGQLHMMVSQPKVG